MLGDIVMDFSLPCEAKPDSVIVLLVIDKAP